MLFLCSSADGYRCIVSGATLPRLILGMLTEYRILTRLSGNCHFFRFYNWRTPLQSLAEDSQGYVELTSRVSEIPQLLIDAKLNCTVPDLDPATRYSILDRAHELKAFLRTAFLNTDLPSNKCEIGTSFDKLGFSLAGLVSLDQLITSLRPVQTQVCEVIEGKTGELCAQLLELELRATDNYPAAELLSAFQLSTP